MAAETTESSVMKIWGDIEEGGTLSISTVIIMMIMSFVTLFITLTKVWEQRTLNKQYADVQKEAQKGSFWSGSLRDNVEKLKGKNHAFRMIAEEGLRAAEHHEGQLGAHVDLHEWVTISLQRTVDSVNSRLTGGLWFLATTGSTAPFVGLFGTVVGIYKALGAIAASGQPSIEQTAGPIGEALLMTAIGLGVAIPAVFFYNVLIRRNKDIMEKTRFFASGVHSYLLSAPARSAARGK